MTDLSLVQWVIYHSFGGSGIDGPYTEKIVVVDKRKYDEIASAYESIKNKLHQHEHGMRNCMSCGSSGEDVKKTETAYICKCGYSWMTLQQVHEAEIN